MLKRKADNTAGKSGSNNKKPKGPTRDVNAPKAPLHPFMHFVRQESKNVGNMKALSLVWAAMDDAQKQPFVDRANADRQEYERAMDIYRKTDAYQLFMNRKRMLQHSRKDADIEPGLNGVTIFSNQFIQYNKSRETALRKLRKEIYDVEEETEKIEERIDATAGELAAARYPAGASHDAARALERCRRLTLRAMEEAGLLGQLHLTADSTIEPLLQRMEEAAKRHDAQSNSLRACLSGVTYDG